MIDTLKEISSALLPAIIVLLLPILSITVRLLAAKVHRLEEGLKRAILYSVKQTTYMIKYSNVPVDVLIADLGDLNDLLANVPDDLMGQILDAYKRK